MGQNETASKVKVLITIFIEEAFKSAQIKNIDGFYLIEKFNSSFGSIPNALAIFIIVPKVVIFSPLSILPICLLDIAQSLAKSC